jgi:uncharacterized protein YjbI with pentapeptide repeats
MEEKLDPFDVAALEKSLNDSAVRVSTIWVSYLIFALYLVIAAGTVTQRQLFLEDPVKLPVLNIDLPLWGFFFLAPILFVTFHAYVLLQVLLLGRTAAAYNEALDRAVKPPPGNVSMRQRLANTLFAQIFAGSPRERKGPIGALLKLMAWVTLAIAPVLVLLVFEFKFLPYHSHFITWTHRLLILTELATVFLLWPLVLDAKRDIDWRYLVRQPIAMATTAVFVLVSMCLATFPGEPHVNLFTGQPLLSVQCGRLISGRFDRLQVPRLDAVDDEKLAKIVTATKDKSQKPSQGERTRDFRDRNLDCGIFDSADLRRADFTRANMTGATFRFAELQGASLEDAQLQGASLDHAQLQGADLGYARLLGASLQGAQLQGANLDGAQMQGADLARAELQDASLRQALLRQANLEGARLQGANLEGAELLAASLRDAQLPNARLGRVRLQHANLDGAQLQGASLVGAQLQGASLRYAKLQDAALVGTNLQGASLLSAQLQGASFVAAQLQGADLGYAELAGANLEGAQLQGASLVYGELQAASLTRAQLQGASLGHARLQGADLGDARLQGADLGYAQLQAASLVGAELQGANLDSAHLQGADLQNSNLKLALLSDALLWRAKGATCTNARISSPNLDPATPEAVSELIEDVAAAVPDKQKNRVRDSMRSSLIVDAQSDDTPDIARSWLECAAITANNPEAKYDQEHAALLRDLVCDTTNDGTVIAEGIALNWIYWGRERANFAAHLARGLLGQDGKDCPGAKELSAQTKERLRSVLSAPTSER